MDWYYALEKNRHGPVSTDELDRLEMVGTITGATLVWREGMDEWLPREQTQSNVKAPPPPPVAPPALAEVPSAAEPPPAVQPAPGTGASTRLPSLVQRGNDMPLPDEPIVDRYGASYALAPHRVHLYPAILRPKKAVEAKELLEEGESSCFYHPQFAAVNVCSHSGRFICDLCSTEWEGETVSLQALHEIKTSGKSEKLKDERMLWDDIALALAVFSILFWPVMIITAPTALFISIWKFRGGPTSIVRRSRIRYILAGILASIEIVVMVFFGLAIANEW